MDVDYTDGTSQRIFADDESGLAKKLEAEMKKDTFKTARVYKGIDLPLGVVNNRANRRKHGYTNAKPERLSISRGGDLNG